MTRLVDMSRLVRDLDFFVSVGLLVTGLATAITGVISDLWDLNDFWYHIIAGYVMGAFGIAHVWLNRERLVGYARFRWKALRAWVSGAVVSRPASVAPIRPVDHDR